MLPGPQGSRSQGAEGRSLEKPSSSLRVNICKQIEKQLVGTALAVGHGVAAGSEGSSSQAGRWTCAELVLPWFTS